MIEDDPNGAGMGQQKSLGEQAAGLKQEASAALEQAKEGGRQALQAVSDGLSNAASEAKRVLTDEAGSRIEAGREKLAQEGERMAESLRAAGRENASEDSLQVRMVDMLADGVRDISRAVRDADPGQALRQAERFARANPGVFVMGAALAGFAAVRFIRASADRAGRTGGSAYSPESY